MSDELILFSPWVYVSMENEEEFKEFIPGDPMITAYDIWPAVKVWAGDSVVHDPVISPINSDLKGLRNVTVFIGTEKVLYPDVTKMFRMLDNDVSNELIVGERMIHCYPLNPIEEARPARLFMPFNRNRDAVRTETAIF
ncbi:MAG: alpha/beta hydrolase fold domain-containing protein [Solobacterium sp.]|nr:alpha/beta hydrolase fold domain-containing protein [Solobacterium sp.]